MPRLTGSQMKYLHVIYMVQKDETGIRSVEISRELGVTKASVSRMMRLLAELGLVTIKKYGNVMLTPDGKSEGTMIHDKVTRIYPFFSDFLELDGPEALDSTYSFLCGFSDNCVKKLLRKEWAANTADS